MRLAIITTHPVQYYAPFFKLLHNSKEITVKVFYTWGEKAQEKFDPGFGENIAWDIPLLEGYDYEWVQNVAADPGSHHFKGIINPGLIGQIKAFHADAVLIYGWAYQSHLKAIRHFKNKLPVYFRGDSNLLDTKKGIKSLLRAVFLKWVYRHIDHAFYAGTHNEAYFKKYGLKPRQLSFAPHAIDNERFFIDRAKESAALRRHLGISDDNIIILFAGKLEEKKSPGLLLDAFLFLDLPNVQLLFVGNGHLDSNLKRKAANEKNIHFMPFQNQSYMPVVYQACDIFCLPSKGPGETWGLAVNEAMASGKTVLTSDKTGCSTDLVVPGFAGSIFKSGDLNDLTAKLRTMAGDKAGLKISGANAKNKIAGWSFDAQADAIVNTIKAYAGAK